MLGSVLLAQVLENFSSSHTGEFAEAASPGSPSLGATGRGATEVCPLPSV
jgi:hypothetical protein